jgi:hypothetical protein
MSKPDQTIARRCIMKRMKLGAMIFVVCVMATAIAPRKIAVPQEIMES